MDPCDEWDFEIIDGKLYGFEPWLENNNVETYPVGFGGFGYVCRAADLGVGG